MGEKTIYLLLGAAFLSLMISFSLSPPSSSNQPCLDQRAISEIKKQVEDLKRVLHDCQSPSTGENLDVLRRQVETCQRTVALYRHDIKELSEKKNILCDEEVCRSRLLKCQ